MTKMPKRTNEFQQIIYMIQKQLANTAVVTESKMLKNTRTGALAEVDIAIEVKVGGIPLKIGVECTAKGRPATVEWVREMIGKHQDLPINKSILVSKMGYTPEALRTAKAHDFSAIMLEEAEKLNWETFVEDIESLILGSFAFTAKGGSVQYDKSELDGHEITIRPELQIIEEGRDIPVSFAEYVNGIIGNKHVVEQVMQDWLKVTREERSTSFDFTVSMTPSTTTNIATDAGRLCRVKSIDVIVHAELESTPLSLKSAKFLDVSVAHGTAKNIFPQSGAPDKNVLVTFVKQEGTRASGSLLIPSFKGGGTNIFTMDVSAKKGE